MKTIFSMIFCLTTIFYSGDSIVHQVMAQDPLIVLTADQEPLGDILNTLSQETGYTFNLNKDWREYPVSATIDNLPLEKGLKRLLRSLNHTIIWESDRVISITIFSKVDPKRPKPANLPALSPRTYQVPPEPVIEPLNESADQEDVTDVEIEEGDNGEGEEDEAQPEEGDDESNPLEGDPVQPRG